jgi:hypothetical protein
MAKRLIFLPMTEAPFVREFEVEFKWFPGMAKSQAQKSILSLHDASLALGYGPILEISSKSPDPLGVALSAFNLTVNSCIGCRPISVESAFQGSKVFETGGPFEDLYNASSLDAKRDDRIRNSGRIIKFSYYGQSFPTQPVTAFYNWLYIRALSQNEHLARQLQNYAGFTDIAFNSKKSWNCQASAAAVYLSLLQRAEVQKAVMDPNWFISIISENGFQSPHNREGQGLLELEE